MRKITTKKFDDLEVDFAWAPNFDGSCLIQYREDRRLPLIAADWDGISSIHFTDEEAEREYDWEGYTRLDAVITNPDGSVQIRLVKEARNNEVA